MSAQGCYCFDFDQLIAAAENGDSQERARGVVVAKVAADDLPGGHQVSTLLAGHVDGRLDHVSELRVGGAQCGLQIGHHLLGLADHVTYRHRVSGFVEGARPGGKDEPSDVVGHGRVGVRSARGELRAAY